MAQNLDASGLLEFMQARCIQLGLTVSHKPGELRGESTSIKSKWWLGGRKALYRMSCRLDDAARTVFFREAVSETSWGLPPPTLTLEKETVSGWERKGKREDVAPGGGGTLEYAKVRTALQEAAREAGWQFHLEGGNLP